MREITITEKQYKELKKLYMQAVEDGAIQLTFQGEQMVTAYVKYLIEYLSPKFAKK